MKCLISASFLLLFYSSFLTQLHATDGVKAPRPALFVETGTWPMEDDYAEARLPLLREILRQGLIISAEQELGWRTFDESIGDLKPEDTANTDLQLSFRLFEKKALDYRFSAGEATEAVTGNIPTTDADPKLYMDALILSEELSRTGFIELLKQLDLPGVEEATRETATDNSLVPQIEQIDFLSLWLNLRELHELLDTYGETPQILSQLSQTYATLGMATKSVSSTAPLACMARSLVYAQRLHAQHPNSAESYYTRTYAWTLTGFPNFALQDLTQAKKLGTAQPFWLPVIESYLNNDFNTLEEHMADPGFNGQLAGMLSVFAIYPTNNSENLFRVAEPAIEAAPKNLQLIHMATEQGGVSSLHRLTRQGPDTLNAMIFNDLSAIDSLRPMIQRAVTPPVRQTRQLTGWDILYSIIDEDHIESVVTHEGQQGTIHFPELYLALREYQISDTDGKQPSTALLGNLIWETRFLHIMNRLRFLRYYLGVPVDEEVQSVLPDIKGHRYEALVKAYAETHRVQEVVAEMEVGEVIGNSQEWLNRPHLTEAKPNFKDLDFKSAQRFSWNTFDITVLEVEAYTHGAYSRKAMRRLNPNSIALIKYSILKDRKTPIYELAARYKDRLHLSAEIPLALGTRFEQENNLNAAKRYYKIATDQDPNSDNLYALAQVYYKLGEHDHWLKTEQRILQCPDHALLHSSANDRIAKGLIEQGRWEDALDYAETAACSGSEWALNTAAWANGLNGNIDRGLDYAIAASQRYNFGYNLASYATAFALKPSPKLINCLKSAYRNNADANYLKRKDAAIIDVYFGKIDSAVTLLQASMNQSNEIWCGLTAAILSDHQGWKDRRDKILENTNTIYPKYKKPDHNSSYNTDRLQMAAFGNFLKLYTEISKADTLTSEHKEQLIKLAEQDPKNRHFIDINAFTAELFRNYGEEELAVEFYTRSLAQKFDDRLIQLLAFQGLRELGYDPIQQMRDYHGLPTPQN